MSCAACGHQSPADSRFCEGCGAALERSCAACGAAVSAGARFCRGCGAKLARTALEKQQRLSQRALRREFSLDAETLADLVDELVNFMRVATLDGEVLVW